MSFRSFKPGTLLSPVPAALISVGAMREGKLVQNAMTAAWVGTVCSEPPMVSVSVRPSRFSYELIEESGEFAVNLTDRAMLRATDFCGVRSGRDMDKLREAGLTAVPADGLRFAPAIAESPLYLSCAVREKLDLGSHRMYIGQVLSMGVREDLIDETGAIRLDRARLVAYCHGTYFELSKALGFFGYSVASPKALKRRMAQLKG